MNYLITGGAGFIGSNLVDKLLSLGHKLTVIDDFSSGRMENLAGHKDNSNLKIIKKNICENLEDIFKSERFDAVFHLAALVSVPYSIEHPDESHEVNANGTFNLLMNCRKFGVKRFIFSSSCSVYGEQDTLPFTEPMKPNPISPYALSKLICEHYCKIFNFLYNLETISLRYFNVYGPRQNPEGNYACLIPKFITLVKNDRTPTINGEGKQTRDFIFVSDVVEANLAALDTQDKSCFGEVFNIGTGQKISVNEVADSIIRLSDKSIKPIYGPAVIEPHDALANIEKAKSILNWQPKFLFEQGLAETFKFF